MPINEESRRPKPPLDQADCGEIGGVETIPRQTGNICPTALRISSARKQMLRSPWKPPVLRHQPRPAPATSTMPAISPTTSAVRSAVMVSRPTASCFSGGSARPVRNTVSGGWQAGKRQHRKGSGWCWGGWVEGDGEEQQSEVEGENRGFLCAGGSAEGGS